MQHVETTNFDFRTKFRKLLTEENYSVITSTFETFCNLTAERAYSVLWNMTYSPQKGFEELSSLGLNPDSISEKDILSFRNELRFQYQILNPHFLKRPVPVECQEAFQNLVNITDPIVSNIIYTNCYLSFDYPTQNFDRILYLLNSENENNYFGGIRSLGFNIEEADYLKPFHIEIHNLLAELIKYKKKNINTALLDFYVPDTEMKKEEDVHQEEDYIVTQPVEKEEEFYREFKPVTAENILVHKETFKAFVEEEDLNLLMVIGTVGFDLNEVMAKREQIRIFIEAAEMLN